MSNLFYVAVGGALGACLRYGMQSYLHAVYAYFPWGTFAANVLGCFLAGYAMRYVPDLGLGTRLFFMTGFLGALTTMSSFSLEFVTMLEERRFGSAVLYWTLNAIVCVVFCGVGLWLALKSMEVRVD